MAGEYSGTLGFQSKCLEDVFQGGGTGGAAI